MSVNFFSRMGNQKTVKASTVLVVKFTYRQHFTISEGPKNPKDTQLVLAEAYRETKNTRTSLSSNILWDLIEP